MIEPLAKLPAEVDYGSEYRYRDPIHQQTSHSPLRLRSSGETATRSRLEGSEKQRRLAASPSATSSAAWRRANAKAPSTRTPAGDRRGVDNRRHHAAGRAVPVALYLAELRGTLNRRRAAHPHRRPCCTCHSCSKDALKIARQWRRSQRYFTRDRISLPRTRQSTTRSRSKAR